MRVHTQIVFKIMILTAFLLWLLPLSPFHIPKENIVQAICNPTVVLSSVELKDVLASKSAFSFVSQQITDTKPIDSIVPTKKIFIYNTHQAERYADDFTIMDASFLLAEELRKEGFFVVYETTDFEEVASIESLGYNKRYTISRRYLIQALEKYGDFDLILDIHRDSTTRQVSLLETNQGNYARMMFVVGTKNNPSDASRLLSQSLTDKINSKVNGIMRSVFTREAMYNQDMNKNMVLIEIGSDQNTLNEVYRSLQVLKEAITEYLS